MVLKFPSLLSNFIKYFEMLVGLRIIYLVNVGVYQKKKSLKFSRILLTLKIFPILFPKKLLDKCSIYLTLTATG